MEKESHLGLEQTSEIENPAETLRRIVDETLSDEQKQLIVNKLEQYGEVNISLS